MTPSHILVFWFMNDWGKYGRTYEMIARHLVRLEDVERVVCVLPPEWLWKGFCPLPFTKNEVSGRLSVITPNTTIIPGFLGLGKFSDYMNNEYIHKSIVKYLEKLGFEKANTLLWVFPPHPFIEVLLSSIPHRMLVSQLVDNNLFKPNLPEDQRAFVKGQYERFASHADIVITSSPNNHLFFSRLNRNTYLFENALDEAFINQDEKRRGQGGSLRPRIGYVGWITYRTDIHIFEYITSTRKEYDLVLAGPIEKGIDLKGLLGKKNVIYKGPISYREVPGFLQEIDVCIMPHLDTPYSQSMSPLKLFQYLGSGKPIVTTRISGIERFESLLYVGDSREDFVKKIDEALEEEGDDRVRGRIEAAKKETWDIRVREILRAIEKQWQEG